MANFNYPINWPVNNIQSFDNHPYQNFFQANPLSDNVRIFPRESGAIQTRTIISEDLSDREELWTSAFQIPCSTIKPKSQYYKETHGIILPP